MKSATTILAVSLFTLSLGAQASGFSDEYLDKVWGEQKENSLTRVGLYAPRLVGGTLKQIFWGRSARRIVRTGEAGVNAINGEITGDQELVEKSGYQASDSAINVLGLGHDVVADIGASAKNVTSATSYRSSRIKLCTTNLMSNLGQQLNYTHFFNPAYHIGVIFDGMYDETSDGGASSDELRRYNDRGIVCEDVPVLSNEPEAIAIERLTRMDTVFNPGYDFTSYNCGGYTRDILKSSGLGYPSFLNMGIGSEIDLKGSHKRLEDERQTAILKCDEHINMVRELIDVVYHEEFIRPEIVEHFNRGRRRARMTPDLVLQLMILASTSQDESLREDVLKMTRVTRAYSLPARAYYQGNDPSTRVIEARYKKQLKNILAAKPGAKVDLKWMQSNDKEMANLVKDIAKLK